MRFVVIIKYMKLIGVRKGDRVRWRQVINPEVNSPK